MNIKSIGLCAALSLVILGGCEARSKDELPTFEMLDVADLKTPAPIPANVDLATGFANGGTAVLTLDRCPSDPVWQTDKGPIGSLVCGASYSVFFVPESKSWVATGPNRTLQNQKAAVDITAAAYVGKLPSAKQIIVWGLGVSWTDDGQALLDGKTLIGHLGVDKPSSSSMETSAMVGSSETESPPASPVVSEPKAQSNNPAGASQKSTTWGDEKPSK